ncbi:hypothetical protein L0244_28165 [bacterium]|nr:hypothetical protein [bacterium]MCI0616872.1 hypothetical protein [bacterium]
MKSKFLVLCLLSTLFVFTFTQVTITADKRDSEQAKANRGNVANVPKASLGSANTAKTSIKSSVVVPSAVNASKAPAPGTTPSFTKRPAAVQRAADSSTKKQKIHGNQLLIRSLLGNTKNRKILSRKLLL